MIRNLTARARQSVTVLRGDRTRRLAVAFAIILLALIALRMLASGRHAWKVEQVPIAFWAWRNDAPSEADMSEARRLTGTDTLFLRAGQIDLVEGQPKRIREVAGSIAGTLDVHLVYNATRKLLGDFERLNSGDLASVIVNAQILDRDRARLGRAQVVGLQLDFDVPTRLLQRYAELLAVVRRRLPAQLRLSITGLPTWMNSPTLTLALSNCDFWVPQFYGARIPERLQDVVPISSSDFVAQSIATAGRYQKPFFAGLSAYGYAIHYAADGRLIELRGDLAPSQAAQNRDLQMLENRPGALERGAPGEWRIVYQARQDTTVDGTFVVNGDYLVLETPTAAGLRTCARAVREKAGSSLLGICVFRMPTLGDATALTITQIAEALKDLDPQFSLDARLYWPGQQHGRARNARLTLENTGSISSCVGARALVVLIRFRGECLRSVAPSEVATLVPLFEFKGRSDPCSFHRANALRVSTNLWSSGTRLTVEMAFCEDAPEEIQLEYLVAGDDGRTYRGVVILHREQAERDRI